MAFESNVALHRIASVVASAAALVTFFSGEGDRPRGRGQSGMALT
jgi:hypothetical protein